MEATPLTPELRAAAPGVARHLGAILMPLAALIARAFLRDPRHVAIIVPLWSRLTRTARRFDRLMARLAAGIRPRPARPGSATGRAARPVRPRVRFPATFAWLVVVLRHEAAAYGSQLNHLLSDSTAGALIAASPQAQRLLRPLCRMLGVTHHAVPRLPHKHRRKPLSPPMPAAVEPAREPIQRAGAARSWPMPPEPGTPIRPLWETAPCEHVLWPWFPRPSTFRG